MHRLRLLIRRLLILLSTRRPGNGRGGFFHKHHLVEPQEQITRQTWSCSPQVFEAHIAWYCKWSKETGFVKLRVRKVVDLCAAPGSWSQVLSRQLYLPAKLSPDSRDSEPPLIVAVDLQPMAPIEGVIQVQGDITNARTAEVVIRHFDGCKADLVVCDGAPDVTGLHDMDEFVQSQLILAGLTIVTHVLRKGGKFIAKIFRGKDTSLLYCQLKLFFPKVTFAKPKSSRNSSIEAFAVCEDYSPPEGFSEKDLYRLLKEVGSPSGADDLDCRSGWLEGPNKVYIPFLACGDLNGYDSDRSYPLPQVSGGTYASLDPVQPPIAPPYKRALELKKASNQGIQQLENLSIDP